MSRRVFAVISVATALTLAGCAEGQQAPSPTTASGSQSAAAQTVTQEQWRAQLDAGNLDALVELLAEEGAAQWVDVQGSEGSTALLDAATAGNAQAVDAFLDAGADPAQQSHAGFPVRSAIHIAAANGDVPTLEVILAHGVDVNQLDGGGGHALLWAAYKGQAEAVQFLLEQGADVGLVDGTGMNAAERAADAGFADVAAQIEAFGAS
ncbi:ankyrin repeat domain-containing protein [Demequina sp.]|uniref:ankyrin repeat domain-containing protein n=1 Tax=Demequina sp. TaxID=2050685 RepID=UPI003D1194B9